MRVTRLAAALSALALALVVSAPAVHGQPASPAPLPTYSPGPPWIPQPRPGAGMRAWLDHHERYVARAREGHINVLFVGDSIVERFATIGKDVWDDRYAPLGAVNFGISGDRTQFLLWRLEHGELDGISPQLVVLEIGTNNLAVAHTDDIVRAIGTLVNYITDKLPQAKLLVVGLLPRGAAANTPLRQKIVDVNRRLMALDAQKNVSFIDVGPQLLDTDGSLSADVMPDGLHPSALGYQLWADAMQDTFDMLLGSATPAP